MNNIIQTILVILTIGFAAWFLIRKFFWKPKRKSSKTCGTDGCGC